MIFLYLLGVEIVKALVIGAPYALGAFIAIKIIFHSKLSWNFSVFFGFLLLTTGVAFSFPFYELSQRFNDWAAVQSDMCEKYVEFWVSDKLPTELVSLKGSNKTKWPRGASSQGEWQGQLIKPNGIKSLAVYDPTKEERLWGKSKSLDGVEGRWKKLWLEDRGHQKCEYFESYMSVNSVESANFFRSLERNGLSNKCVAIEVVEDESNIVLITKSIETKKIYRSPGFSINLETVRAYNEVTGEEYARLSRLMSGWPRFPDNFHSAFVAKGGSCDKYRAINRNRINGATLISKIYNVKQG